MPFWKKAKPMPERHEALPGRNTPMPVAPLHRVLGRPMTAPYPAGSHHLLLGMGCFWGAERLFWQTPGVITTAVGYAGGWTPHPTYEEVCSGLTGHAEVVRVVYDPTAISLEQLLKIFWEQHDPTQGMRQGNDVGTQYRSAIYCDDPDQLVQAQASAQLYQTRLSQAGLGPITTERALNRIFYFAEDEHQQYLAKHPNGYCGLAGTGIVCPLPSTAHLERGA